MLFRDAVGGGPPPTGVTSEPRSTVERFRGSSPVNRRDFLRAWGVAGALAVTGVGTGSVAAQSDPELNDIWTGVLPRSPDDWGKWGDDDEEDDRSGDGGNSRVGHSEDGTDD